MPLVGLTIGYAASLLIGDAMHFVGALLLIGVGGWQLWEEGRECMAEGKERASAPPAREQLRWQQQLLLALSVSMDELAIGFSFGSAAAGKAISACEFSVLLGLQGFLLTVSGLAIGRTLGARLIPYREWSELLGAALLVALGICLLFS
jgi:putative Mn2+ efflux pump MntP